MKRPENRVVDEKEYQIMYMGPKQQIRTLKFMMTTVGRPLGVLAQDDSGKGPLDANAKIIGLFIKEALSSLDEEKIIEQIEILLKFAQVSNDNGGYKPVSMEKDFQGELLHLFNVVKAVLEVNFGRFLGVNTGLLAKLKDKFVTLSDR